MSEHNCLNVILNELKQHHGGEVYLTGTVEVVINRDFENRHLRPKQMVYEYQCKGKDGKLIKKFKKSFVSFAFCPFCGGRYAEIEANKKTGLTDKGDASVDLNPTTNELGKSSPTED